MLEICYAVMTMVYLAPLLHVGFVLINLGPLSITLSHLLSHDCGEHRIDPFGFQADTYSCQHAATHIET